MWGTISDCGCFAYVGEGVVSDWMCSGLRTFQYGGVSLVAQVRFSLMAFLVQVVISVTLLHKRRKLLNIMGVGFCKHIGDQYIFNYAHQKYWGAGPRAPPVPTPLFWQCSGASSV